jgi:hypothetical protein
MATRDEIRAVFADPRLDGMDRLYDAIGEMLLTGAEFENAYSLVIAAGDVQATTWIKFCVQCATRFDDPPEESEFLAVLEEFSRTHVGASSTTKKPRSWRGCLRGNF